MPESDVISTVSFFRDRQRIEAATTANVLRALTPEMLDFRPHPDSSSIAVIAWTIVRCLRLSNTLTHAVTAEVPRDSPPDYNTLLMAYDEAATALNVSLIGVTQSQWEAGGTVTSSGRAVLQQPLGQILWLFHVDSIHHRGQLSVFLRPFGSKVPSIYGPSADCNPSVTTN